ncbi:MAG: class I SAM-dependent methyltransferase [Thermoanaerobaculia bacterium]
MSDRYVEAPPAGLEGWRRVWSDDLRYRPGRSPLRFLGSIFEKLFGRILAPERDRQRDFNLAVLQLLDDLRGDIRSVDTTLQRLNLDLHNLATASAKRSDALIAAMDQKTESVASRLRDLTAPLISPAASGSVTLRDDLVYRHMEDALRGSPADLAVDLAFWVDQAGGSAPVIDLGCGRGEFLELCRARGIAARGIDSNERSVATLREKGLDVALGRIPECFASMGEASVGSIFAAHVVEHLTFTDLVSLFAESARVLRPGGLLMIETPNAESLAVTGSTFWRDPTHLTPRHPAALTLIAREYGFAVERLETSAPLPDRDKLHASPDAAADVQAMAGRLNALLFADQNVRLLLRKGH